MSLEKTPRALLYLALVPSLTNRLACLIHTGKPGLLAWRRITLISSGGPWIQHQNPSIKVCFQHAGWIFFFPKRWWRIWLTASRSTVYHRVQTELAEYQGCWKSPLFSRKRMFLFCCRWETPRPASLPTVLKTWHCCSDPKLYWRLNFAVEAAEERGKYPEVVSLHHFDPWEVLLCSEAESSVESVEIRSLCVLNGTFPSLQNSPKWF